MNTATNDPSFSSDLTGFTENNDYGHEPAQQLLDGAPGLPDTSNCNSSTTTGENQPPALPVWDGSDWNDDLGLAASQLLYGQDGGA